MTEAEDVIEIRRKGALVRIEHSIEVREEQNLAERISLILSEVRKADDGKLIAEAESLQARYLRSLFKDFANFRDASDRMPFTIAVKIKSDDNDGHPAGAIEIKFNEYGDRHVNFVE